MNRLTFAEFIAQTQLIISCVVAKVIWQAVEIAGLFWIGLIFQFLYQLIAGCGSRCFVFACQLLSLFFPSDKLDHYFDPSHLCPNGQIEISQLDSPF